MNIADNLALLAQTKENIRQAINRKGVVLESSAPFSAYSAAIMAISAATPTPEPVNYTYALSMDNGADYGAGELDGAWDDSIGAWTMNYVDLYYGSGDWEQGNFVSSGTVSPSAYSLENNPDGAGVSDTDYNVGFDNEQGKWYIQANDNTVNYSDQGEFFCVKATSGNSVDISGATMTVNIGTVDARPEQGGEIPEGLWKFNVTQEGGTNVIWVEGFMENNKSSTPQETIVKIYEDPNGEPINTITYSYISKFSEGDVSQTNSSAGLYAAQYSSVNSSNDPILLGLSCNTAGTYYIEVVDHANPRFYDDTNTEIYPNNYVNS